MIRFLLDQELVELKDVAPDLTVLDWLRVHRQRTGTKEGCGSGDCGACTVVLASAEKNDDGRYRLIYRSMNSCIAFVGALHGKQLLTVESLATDGVLHPVQQCMVSEHGSQCGFCTPGFVMSLYALYQQDEKVEVLKEQVDRALGGNLCRCTGYHPIKQAAEKALNHRAIQADLTLEEAETTALEKTTIELLRQLSSQPAEVVGFYQPDTLTGFATYLQSYPDARILAGGTDLALEVTQQLRELPAIVSVNAVSELKQSVVTDTHLELGAAVTLNECLAIMQSRIPGATELLLRFGSDQVRNQGTIGGNIGSASPIGDLPPLLIALNASITIQCGDKIRTLALEDHYLGYRKTSLKASEFIHSVHIPLPRTNSKFAVHKISKRTDDDISSVCMAIHLPFDNGIVKDCRVAFGGMAAIPIRAKSVEQMFNEKEFSQEAVYDAQRALANELNPITDARASASYRMQVAKNLLQRVLLEVTDS
jgi:xanthine dehydrogenase small subunit